LLTKYDEFLCHQIVSTFDHVETSAREWTERAWVFGWDVSAKVLISAGIGRYLNRNIIDAYGTVNIAGKTQYAVRASRELRSAVDEVKVGPFSYEVIEPLKRVCFTLDENEHGLSYELECDGIAPCVEEPRQFTRYKGRVAEHVIRYLQTARMKGWIKVEGKTYEVTPDRWQCARDRSWGIRRGAMVEETGVEPPEIPEGYFYNLALIQFEKWGAQYHIREDWQGTPTVCGGKFFYPYGIEKEELQIVKVDHDFQFHPGEPRRMKSGWVVLTGADGSKTEISIRPIAAIYLAPGGYFGYKGFVHGQWMGPYFLDGLKLNLTDQDVKNEVNQASILIDQVCELHCGDEVGQGMYEVVLLGKYPKYGYQGY